LTGNFAAFRRDVLGFLQATVRDYGDVAGFCLGRRPCVLVSHPDLIESVLVKNNRNFIKPFAFRFTRAVLGNGLLTSEGDFWLRQRRLAAPAFRAERVAGYGPDMVAAAGRMLDTWHDGQTRDIHADMMQVTLDIVAQTLFGADVSDQSHEVDVALRGVLRSFSASFNRTIPLPRWLPTPGNRRARAAVRSLNQVVQRLIDERRSDQRPRRDLLSMLLEARDEDGSRMTDDQLADEARTFLLAGHETTAITLSWTWFLLASHPRVQAELADELDAVLGGRLPESGDLPRLKVAERIIQEAMRLYPPAFIIGREALADFELGGYSIPAGTTVFMSPWVVHRDARFFDSPATFKPERWAGEQIAALPKMAYFPFGGGPRVCIGNAFAMLESVLLLSTIAQRWSIALVEDHPIRLSPVFTLRPKFGIQVVVSQRPRRVAVAAAPADARAIETREH
jgi:cytochrome P450